VKGKEGAGDRRNRGRICEQRTGRGDRKGNGSKVPSTSSIVIFNN